MDKESIKSWLITIAVAFVLALIIRNFIFNTSNVKGPSMEATLHQNDHVISLVFPLFYKDPEPGQIVIIQSPFEKKKYVKRLIGLPGDRIQILNGRVYVNEKEIDEPYIQGTETLVDNENTWTLGPDDYFVMGDNRLPGESMDSRAFGPVHKKAIKGIVVFRYFPFNKFGKL
ncbi:MAG: signal peptidase I [Peptoniphilus sp. oral taxon 375]|nr:signal peptidase I [Peptoniphilus sp. oral taxon 375 str. F0436]MBS4871796.1 signal peptidase I [Peptoniphilus sp. oral taxon 375]